MNLLAPDELLYVRAMGRIFPVTGLFEANDDVTAWLRRHPDEGVICVHYGRIYTAKITETGRRIADVHPHAHQYPAAVLGH